MNKAPSKPHSTSPIMGSSFNHHKKFRCLPFSSAPAMLAMAAGAALLAFGAPSARATPPVFLETFSTDASNWKIDSIATPTAATWVGTGGPAGVGDGYISRPAPTAITGQGVAVFRGQDNYNSSNNGFVGDWISARVTNFSINIRQDSGIALNFFLRLSLTAPNNNPAASTNSFSVPSGVWTNINIPIVDSANSFASYEGGSFNSVFSSIGKVQLFVTTASASGATISIDNPAIVPEPSSLALLGAAGVCGLLMRRRSRR